MTGFTRTAETFFINGSNGKNLAVTQPYDIYTSGNFNADGITDMIVHYRAANASNGTLKLWTFNGVRRIGSFGFSPSATNLYPAGTGDFDGNGRTDIVLQNANNGDVTIWYLGPNGTTGLNTARVATAVLSPQLSSYSAERVVGVTDFNGDGVPDLLLQDLRTSTSISTRGNVSVLLLNSASPTSGIVTSLGRRNMLQQIADPKLVVRGVDDMNADGLADIVVQMGTVISYFPRFVPAGQTVLDTQTFNFGTRQSFLREDGTTALTAPSTSWTIRN